MKYKNVIWDWNGTLLDDLDAGVNTLNDMLQRRGLPGLSVQEYKDQFGFPVIDFYHKVGFDLEKESMHTLSVDFVNTYDIYAGSVKLNQHVPKVLAGIQEAGIRQYILSALREDLLKQMVCDFEIGSHFNGVCGSDNIYAAGKVERGQQMLQVFDIFPEETLMVGDTIHDAEVAFALGFDCLLFTGGHNSEGRLLEKAPVIHRIDDLLKL